MPNALSRYFKVLKPAMVVGNLVNVAGGFLLGSRGSVDAALFLWTTVGTALVVASGCVFNNCIDRRLDRKMVRTRNRVMAKGEMSPGAAFAYAAILAACGLALLWTTTNRLSVAVIAAGLVVYVLFYTLWLKRTSVYGTLIGSLAGAAPPLAGYCAASQRFDLGALILLAIFSLWQIPHSYSIAVFRWKDYTAAAIPVLPVRRGIFAAKKQIAAYILAFTATASLLTIGGYTGYRYLAVTTSMGLLWLFLTWSGYREKEERWGKRLFIFSIVSIAMLNLMLALDVCLPSVGPYDFPRQPWQCARTGPHVPVFDVLLPAVAVSKTQRAD